MHELAKVFASDMSIAFAAFASLYCRVLIHGIWPLEANCIYSDQYYGERS